MKRRPAFLPAGAVIRSSFLSIPHPQHAPTSSRPRASTRSSLADRVAALPPSRASEVIELLSPSGQRDTRVANIDGKRASFRIFSHVAVGNGGYVFGKNAATEALKIYGDIVDEAKAQRGAHPSIDWLLDVVETDDVFVVKVDGNYGFAAEA